MKTKISSLVLTENFRLLCICKDSEYHLWKTKFEGFGKMSVHSPRLFKVMKDFGNFLQVKFEDENSERIIESSKLFQFITEKESLNKILSYEN